MVLRAPLLRIFLRINRFVSNSLHVVLMIGVWAEVHFSLRWRDFWEILVSWSPRSMRSKIFKETHKLKLLCGFQLLKFVRAFKTKALSSSNDISDHTEIVLSAYLPSQHKLSRSRYCVNLFSRYSSRGTWFIWQEISALPLPTQLNHFSRICLICIFLFIHENVVSVSTKKSSAEWGECISLKPNAQYSKADGAENR